MPILLTPYYHGLKDRLSDKGRVLELINCIREGGKIGDVLSRLEITKIGQESTYYGRDDTETSTIPTILTETQRYEVFNIIKHDGITKRVITDLEDGAINLSGNPLHSHDMTAEQELKALVVAEKKLIKALEKEGFEEQFSGLIWDLYNDFTVGKKLEHGKDDKAVHRVRFKIDDNDFDLKHLLTLKRKDKDQLDQSIGDARTRTCFEIEYLIQKFRETTYNAERLGLQPSREKIKYRKSFHREYEGYHVVADIDYYCGIPVLVELEISRIPNKNSGLIVINEDTDRKFITMILKDLGLSDNELFHKGSRKLFEKYGIPYRDF